MSFFKSISAENISYFRHQTESIIEEATKSKPGLQRLSKPSSCLTIEQFEQHLSESKQYVIQHYTTFLKAGLITLFYLNSIDSLSPNLLLTSVEHAKCPLGSENKNKLKNKISLEILIEQCCEWFSHVVSQQTSSSPKEVLQIVQNDVIQKLQTTELNSIKFITGHYISIFEYVADNEKNKDPTYSLCKILHDMITKELQEQASNNSQVLDLINYASELSATSQLFRIPVFQKSLLKFLSVKTHMPEASEFLPYYFKYEELCKKDSTGTRKQLDKEKYEIALKIVAVIKKKILNMDSDDTEHIISHVQSHRNSLSDTIFTKLYNETANLIITNYLNSYSQIQFWKSSEFFEMCNSLNIPAFAVRQ